MIILDARYGNINKLYCNLVTLCKSETRRPERLTNVPKTELRR